MLDAVWVSRTLKHVAAFFFNPYPDCVKTAAIHDKHELPVFWQLVDLEPFSHFSLLLKKDSLAAGTPPEQVCGE
jgi:hypothetical protein